MSKFRIITAVAALGVLVLLAYLAPRFVDQNSLRAWIEPQLQRALHQEVTIDGAIDFALLPRPMVQVRQISVGRPDHKTADIPEIEATLKLGPLLMGRLEPDQLVLSRPDIHLGGVPLPKVPAAVAAAAPPADEAAPAPAEAPAPFKNFTPRDIGRVVIEKGTLSLPGLTLSPIDLKIVTSDDTLTLSGHVGAGRSAAQIDGDAHWLDGQLQASNLALRFDSGATLRWTGQGDPLSLDHPLAGKLTGRLGDPALILGEKAPAVPVALAADIAAQPGQFDAVNLTLSLGDADFQGEAHYLGGATPHSTLRLHAATLDLAKLPSAAAPPPSAAAPAEASLPPPPALTTNVAPEPSRPLPFLRGFALQLDLSADQILWRGKILQDAKFSANSVNGDVTIDRAEVTLPGNSQLSLTGGLDEDSRFAGSFEARSDDLRELLRWADLDPARVPADRLHAARLAGHVQGDLTEVTLQGVRLKLDSSVLDVSATIRPGPRSAIGLTFALDTLNGDAYWPVHPAAAAPAADAAPPAEAADAAPQPAKQKKPAIAFDAEVHGRIGHLIWRGQSVSDVALDTTFTADGIIVRSLSAGDLAGAQASVSGAVSLTDQGWTIDHAKAMLHSRDIGRTLRGLGVDLPLDGQADLAADLAGSWYHPSMNVTAPMLNLGHAYLDHVALNVALPPGRFVFDHLSAGLYGGQLTGEGSIAHDGSPSTLHLALANAQVKKALLEVADLGLAEGELAGEVDLNSAGKASEMLANLAGTGSLSVKNGLIHGFDLKAANDKLKGKEGLGGLLALLQAGLTGGDTRFSSLAGTAKAEHGVIETHDLKLDADGGGATGVATINLPADTIDAHADFHFANAPSAPPLTMRLQGSLRSPHRYLDVKPLQQWLSEHGVKTGKPKDVLKGLLQGLTR